MRVIREHRFVDYLRERKTRIERAQRWRERAPHREQLRPIFGCVFQAPTDGVQRYDDTEAVALQPGERSRQRVQHASAGQNLRLHR